MAEASRKTGTGSDAGISASISQSSSNAAALDKLIHEKNRLAIISALAATPKLSFIELKDLLAMSDGNLSTHARKLEEAGYIRCKKSFAGRMPRSDYSLTARGRAALNAYLEHMEALIRAVRQE